MSVAPTPIHSMRACFVLALSLLLPGTPSALAQAEAQPDQAPAAPAPAAPATPPSPGSRDSICLMIESAARANDLPVDYFARVIWQESRFQPGVVGPPTRSGQRAQGIAQFMPGTAAERRLLDPFDPVEALPKSAEFLAELRNQFGNLGLAAAAYNAGPQRLRDFMTGTRPLPAETRNYVLAITGLSVDDWAKAAKPAGQARPQPAVASCHDLVALLRQTPNPFVEGLQERINLVAGSPWGVELGAGFSREQVVTAYAGLLQRFGEILSGHDPSILAGILRSRGTRPFYQVRIGAETRESANGLCAKIKHAGGACIVLRNSNRSG
ncbi:MAG TPA: lytic transglycosylase domain-containing protein [Xanthobacteraceae bacterium]